MLRGQTGNDAKGFGRCRPLGCAELLERLEKLRRDLNELEGGPADLPRLTLREDLRKVSNIYVNNTFDLKGERLMVVHDFYMAKEAEKLGVTISGPVTAHQGSSKLTDPLVVSGRSWGLTLGKGGWIPRELDGLWKRLQGQGP